RCWSSAASSSSKTGCGAADELGNESRPVDNRGLVRRGKAGFPILLDASRRLWSLEPPPRFQRLQTKFRCSRLVSQRAGAMRPDLAGRGFPRSAGSGTHEIPLRQGGERDLRFPFLGSGGSYRPAAIASALGGPDAQEIYMSRQSVLPPTLAPRLINREVAAAYVSVSPTTFDEM